MRRKMYVSPSTDPISPRSKNFANKIVAYAQELLDAGADFLHCDVMDGDFVNNRTYDYDIVRLINTNCLIPLDVHLMVTNPVAQIEQYVRAGANFLTIHYESFENEEEFISALKVIRGSKLLAGMSFKPGTPVEKIEKYLPYCDIVMVMSVNPGMSGKKFLPQSYDKIEQLATIRKKKRLKFLLQVDGGMNPEIAQEVKKMGVDIVVSGNFIYKSKDRKEAIALLR